MLKDVIEIPNKNSWGTTHALSGLHSLEEMGQFLMQFETYCATLPKWDRTQGYQETYAQDTLCSKLFESFFYQLLLSTYYVSHKQFGAFPEKMKSSGHEGEGWNSAGWTLSWVHVSTEHRLWEPRSTRNSLIKESQSTSEPLVAILHPCSFNSYWCTPQNLGGKNPVAGLPAFYTQLEKK